MKNKKPVAGISISTKTNDFIDIYIDDYLLRFYKKDSMIIFDNPYFENSRMLITIKDMKEAMKIAEDYFYNLTF